MKTMLNNAIRIDGFLRLLGINWGSFSETLKVSDGNSEMTAIPFNPKIELKLGLAWKKRLYLSNASKAFISYFELNNR